MIQKESQHIMSAQAVKTLLIVVVFLSFATFRNVIADGSMTLGPFNLEDMEKKVAAIVPDTGYPDEPFILVTLKEALLGIRERNGGIGACLVQEGTGEIVERSHNRQYEPYFRSDLHAEMDLLTRYEERVRLTRSLDPGNPSYRNPRNMAGLVLYTSVEPCPMCLTRIINAGVKKVYYAAPDPEGGMAGSLYGLPPFWKAMAQGMILEPARCSPELTVLAKQFFHPMAKNKK